MAHALKTALRVYYIGLFLLPLQIQVPLPGLGSVELATVVLGLDALVVGVLLGWARQYPKPGLLTAAAAFFFAAITVANLSYGLNGIFALRSLLYMTLVFELTRVLAVRFQPAALITVWLWASAMVVVISLGVFAATFWRGDLGAGVSQYANFPYIGRLQRVQGSFANASALIAYLSVGIFLAQTVRHRLLRIMNIPLAFFLGVITLSKVAVFNAAALCMTRRKAAVVAGVVLAGIAAILPLAVVSTLTADEIAATYAAARFPEWSRSVTFNGRSYQVVPSNLFGMKVAAARVFGDHLWVGVGLRHFQNATEALVVEGRLPRGALGFMPHCTYLGLAAENGLIGLAGLAALIAAAGWTLYRRRRIGPLKKALTGLAISWLLVAIHTDVLLFPAVWFSLGLMAVDDEPT